MVVTWIHDRAWIPTSLVDIHLAGSVNQLTTWEIDMTFNPEFKTTARGFPYLEFEDSNGQVCSFQCSSAIDFNECEDGSSGLDNQG